MQDSLHYDDQAALKARLVQRHGTDLGELVFNAEVQRRQLQDARLAELKTESTAILANISELRTAAGQRQQQFQAKLEAAYATYLTECKLAAESDSLDQAAVAPLMARSLSLQQEMRAIATPRLTERELQSVAIFNSSNASMLRTLEKKLPPLDIAVSELEKINLGVGIPKLRS